MKKKFIILSMCLLLATGCGSKIPKLKDGSDAVVTLNDGSKISVDELYNEVKSSFALEALINMVDKKILEDKYKDEIENATTQADATMKSLEENYQDDLAQMIQYYTGYQTVEAYKNSIYLGYFQNLVTQDYAKSQVSDKEINAYYKDKVYGDVEVSHILITPKTKDSMKEEEKKTAETEAENKAKELIEELKKAENVKEKFKELAKSNSEDEATKENGGSLGYINYGTVSDSYDSLVDAALKLKNGEFSTSVIKTSLGYHIILRTNQKEKASLDDVKDTIIEKLSEEIISKDTTISVKAMQELRKEYGVEIQDSELKEQYANYIQNALSQKNTTSSNE